MTMKLAGRVKMIPIKAKLNMKQIKLLKMFTEEILKKEMQYGCTKKKENEYNINGVINKYLRISHN